MSESTHRKLSDSTEMRESSDRGNRLRSAAIAVIAVLAALGTLFAHHRSIEALTSKNQAILLQARASQPPQRSANRLPSQTSACLSR